MSTMRDIARLAGVSVATVSRVVNNDTTYRMRKETRDRVWRAIADTNYQVAPPRMEATRKGPLKNKRIGCVLSIVKDKYRDPYFMSVLSGIEERFAQNGYALGFLHTLAEFSNPFVLREALEEPPAGLILMETVSPPFYETLRAKIPACVGVDTLHEDIDNVGYDQFDTARRAVNTLIEKGHTRIAFIGGSPSDAFEGHGRYIGYRYAMQSAGLEVKNDWMRNCRWDERTCMAQVREMMVKPECPTAIFAASDLMAIAALSALYSMRINVPGQVAVIGISNIELAQFSSPPLTTYEVPAYEIGLLAADFIHDRLTGSFPLPRRVLLPSRLIERESV